MASVRTSPDRQGTPQVMRRTARKKMQGACWRISGSESRCRPSMPLPLTWHCSGRAEYTPMYGGGRMRLASGIAPPHLP